MFIFCSLLPSSLSTSSLSCASFFYLHFLHSNFLPLHSILSPECSFSSSFRYYKSSLLHLFVFILCHLPSFRFNFSQFRIISLTCYASFPLRLLPMYDNFYFSSFPSSSFRMMPLSFCILLLGILYMEVLFCTHNEPRDDLVDWYAMRIFVWICDDRAIILHV